MSALTESTNVVTEPVIGGKLQETEAGNKRKVRSAALLPPPCCRRPALPRPIRPIRRA